MHIFQFLIAVLILGVLVFVHELGHFVTAKLAGMPVADFSIGMGPVVVAFGRADTTYSLRAIPVGGSVAIEGMDLDSDKEDGFNKKGPFARIVVLSAGVFMNFLFSIIVLFLSGVLIGKYVTSTEPVIGGVLPVSHANIFLRPGDRILSINGAPVDVWSDISKNVRKNAAEKILTLRLEYLREGQKQAADIPLTELPESGDFVLGVTSQSVKVNLSPKESFIRSLTLTRDIFFNIFRGLGSLVRGKVKKEEVSGPIGIVRQIGQWSEDGVGTLLFFAAMLSVNLGIINLLPIPALDGGRILFVLLELLHIRVNKKIEERIHYAGYFMLLALIFLITVNDVVNIFKG
ncbi:MAG: RIP metalloprotease RseP [Fusobacteriaceae bacterium]|jgi:regulator of sigma E protease|nr:RIP metalloprotease RseP [Fusobacteriaceae bacterium]